MKTDYTILQKYVKQMSDDFKAIRKVDILEYGIQNGFKKKEIEAFLKNYKPYVYNKNYISKPKISQSYAPLFTKSLGNLQMDIMFLSKKDHKTPPTLTGILASICISSKRVFFELLFGGKNAKSLIKSVDKTIKRYEIATGVAVTSLSWDGEVSTGANRFVAYLNEKNIDLVQYKNSRTKASASENLIRRARTFYFRLKVAKDGNIKPLYQCIKEIENGLNSRPIYLNGKKIPFHPGMITSENFNKYVNIVEKHMPAIFFMNTTLYSEGYKRYKYDVGDFVNIILKSIEGTFKLNSKRSERSVTKIIYQIKRRFLFITTSYHLAVGYIVREYSPPFKGKEVYNSYFFSERDLVPHNISD